MVDDGGRSGKYVVSTLGAVFEYICWRVLEFTSWNYAVEVFETSAASIHEKSHFPVKKLETSKHQPISNISVNEWSSSEVYQWSMTFQPKSFHFKSSTFDSGEKHEALTCLCTNGRFLDVFLTHLEWLKITPSEISPPNCCFGSNCDPRIKQRKLNKWHGILARKPRQLWRIRISQHIHETNRNILLLN